MNAELIKRLWMLDMRPESAPRQAAGEIERLKAEVERLTKLAHPEWFYPADGYDGDRCYFSVDEVLDEDYFYDRYKAGQHVVEINVATSLPSIWAAVKLDLSRFDAAPLIAFTATKETDYGTETDGRIPQGCGAHSTDQWTYTQAGC